MANAGPLPSPTGMSSGLAGAPKACVTSNRNGHVRIHGKSGYAGPKRLRDRADQAQLDRRRGVGVSLGDADVDGAAHAVVKRFSADPVLVEVVERSEKVMCAGPDAQLRLPSAETPMSIQVFRFLNLSFLAVHAVRGLAGHHAEAAFPACTTTRAPMSMGS